MITIQILKEKGSYKGLRSKGHAGYARAGKDIVCAAVSALLINTVNSLEKFTDDKVQSKSEDGYLSFKFVSPPGEKGTLLMDSLVLGLMDIEKSCNNRYLTVTLKEV